MKKVMFISILLISILFISSCELFVPGGRSPQFSEDINMPFELPIPIFVKFFNRIDCSEIAPPYGGGCTSGVPGERSSITCDEGTPYCSSGNTCTIPDSMCVYLEDETSCHCQDEPPEPFCGDGQINQDWEECDCGQNGCEPIELAYQTCSNQGFTHGTLGCYPREHVNECMYDASECYFCDAGGCDRVCLNGCFEGDDPDCGCVQNNGCCGIGCDLDSDGDCLAFRESFDDFVSYSYPPGWTGHHIHTECVQNGCYSGEICLNCMSDYGYPGNCWIGDYCSADDCPLMSTAIEVTPSREYTLRANVNSMLPIQYFDSWVKLKVYDGDLDHLSDMAGRTPLCEIQWFNTFGWIVESCIFTAPGNHVTLTINQHQTGFGYGDSMFDDILMY